MRMPLRFPTFVISAYQKSKPVLEWLPFTFGGAIFCAAACLAFWFFGVQRSDFVLIVIGSVGVSMSVLGLVITWGVGVLLWRRYRTIDGMPLLLRVGETHIVDAPIVVPWWAPLVQIGWSWTSDFMDVELVGHKERLTPNRRGISTQVDRCVSVGDAFGICSIQFIARQSCAVKVVPETIGPTLPRILQGVQGGGDQAHPFGLATGDRIDIRNYAQGDPVRFILWKVYARTGQLVVRTPEKAFEPIQRLLAYLIVHPSDGSAAALSTSVIQSNQLGENWALGVDGYQGACTEISAAVEAITASGNSTVEDGEGLEEFLSQEKEASSLLVFAPAKKGRWIDAVIQASSKIPVQVCVVGKAPPKQSPFGTLLFNPEMPATDQLDSAAVLDIMNRLEPSGITLSIVLSTGLSMDGAEFLRQFQSAGAA